MNRHSVTGPLLLVGVGVVLLLHNFAPDVRIYASYWPFAIVAVGIFGLMEVLFHASRGNPIPPRPISSWVWVLGVIVAMGAWGYRRNGIHLGRLEASGINLLGTSYDYDVNATSTESGISRVVLENMKGNINVRGNAGGRGDSFTVTGHRSIRAYNKVEADQANAGTIKLDRRGDTLVIHAQLNDQGRVTASSSDLDIVVPGGVTIEARDRNGDLAVDDITGGVEVSNGRGEIRLNNIGKDVKIETRRSGLIRVTNVLGNLDMSGSGDEVQVEHIAGLVSINGKYSGTLEFRALAKQFHFESDVTDLRAVAVPGSLVLDLAELKVRGVTGPFRFQTKTRDVEMEDVSGVVDIMLDRGDVRFSGGPVLPKLDVHTRNGDVNLILPEGAPFELKAATGQGEVENDYGIGVTTETSGRAATAKGSSGSKGPQLVVMTDRGTVSIKKK